MLEQQQRAKQAAEEKREQDERISQALEEKEIQLKMSGEYWAFVG